jgi:undecaprenyl-diphosphatase
MIRHLRTRAQKAWAAFALLSVELVITLVIFFAALVAFVWLVRRVFVVQRTGFDEKAFTFLGGHVNPIRTDVMEAVTFLGTHFFLIPANLVLIAWFLFVRRHKWYSIKVPAISISSLLLMFGLKDLFARARPLEPLLGPAGGYSFPSGHALMSTTFYGLLAYLAWRHIERPLVRYTVVVGLVLLVLFIGLSRIYLRVHYTSDVLAGLCLGIAWLIFSITTIRRIERWSDQNVQAEHEPEVA